MCACAGEDDASSHVILDAVSSVDLEAEDPAKQNLWDSKVLLKHLNGMLLYNNNNIGLQM